MNPESQPSPLPLDELSLTPQWLKAPARSFEQHSGQEERPRRGDRSDRRDSGGGGARGPRREQGGEQRDRRREMGHGKPGGRPSFPPGGKGKFQQPSRGPHRPEQRPFAPVAPTVALDVVFFPEEKGFGAMLEAMKQPPKAYRLFDIAKLILNKPERHLVKLTRLPVAGATTALPLYVVKLGEAVFLTQAEAVRFVLREYAEKICKVEKKPVEPPKGNFQFVCKCGMTGEVLGPSIYHEYQSRIVRHHQRRLAHVPFEMFKSRIETVRDPEAVKAWVESMSFVVEYQCLLEAEPTTFASREELEKHFVENHLAEFVTSATEVALSGSAIRERATGAILDRVREEWEAEWKFPLKTANTLRPRFSHEGFTHFKRQKGISFVSKIKPKRLESLEHLAPHIQKMITFLREQDGATGTQLLAHLNEGAAPDAPPAFNSDTLVTDLHWLVTEGYVVEFSDGRLWSPKEKPPEPQKSEAKSNAVASEVETVGETPEVVVAATPVEQPAPAEPGVQPVTSV